MSDSGERILHLLTLAFQLSLIAQMLQLTAAAFLVHRTRRLHTLGRCFDNLLQRTNCIAFLHQRNSYAHLFLRQRAFDKDRKALVLAYALTATSETVDS